MPDSVVHDKASSVTVSRLGGVTVLTPSGVLTSERCHDLDQVFAEATDERSPRLVLDCKAVALMDSEVLELIVRTHRAVEEGGGALRLANLNDVCREIMTATRLVNVLHIHADLNSAIKSER